MCVVLSSFHAQYYTSCIISHGFEARVYPFPALSFYEMRLCEQSYEPLLILLLVFWSQIWKRLNLTTAWTAFHLSCERRQLRSRMIIAMRPIPCRSKFAHRTVLEAVIFSPSASTFTATQSKTLASLMKPRTRSIDTQSFVLHSLIETLLVAVRGHQPWRHIEAMALFTVFGRPPTELGGFRTSKSTQLQQRRYRILK